MTDQLPLFGALQAEVVAVAIEAKPLHRRADSAGSRAAARETIASGRRETHDSAVLAALDRQPWLTSLELDAAEHPFLAERGVKDRTEAARRLPGLLARGLVIRLDPDDNPSIRPCGIAHSRCFRWASADTWRDARPWLNDPAAVPVIDRGAGEKTLAIEAVA